MKPAAGTSSQAKDERYRELMTLNPYDGWDKCWEEEITTWDLGEPTPIIAHLHKTGSLPTGRVLFPGCGSGHDVVAIASADRYVVGIDMSDHAINKAIQLSSGSANAQHFKFLKTDFFSWHPTDDHLFDLIVDHSFFCAIVPDMRPVWAKKVSDLLKPGGELITIMYPIHDVEGGPPYKVSIASYEEVLHPVGLKAFLIEDNELTIVHRRGREKLGRWKKI